MENVKQLIGDLRKHGLSNGGSLGHHSGLMDEAADALESMMAKEQQAHKYGVLGAAMSHIKAFEIEKDLGFCRIRKVVLFNQKKISEDEALRHVQAEEYNDNVVVLENRQWVSLFLNKECETERSADHQL